MNVVNLLMIEKQTDDLKNTLREADCLADQMDARRNPKIHFVVKIGTKGKYEIYVPFEKKCTHIPVNVSWKQRLFIDLAIKARYEGSIEGFLNQISQIENYLELNKLTSITEYYCIIMESKMLRDNNFEEVIIDSYVGISENIL
jgi:hypothetical protein